MEKMSSFKIHTGKSSELKEKLDDTSSGIKMIAEDVKSIKNVLALSGSAGTGVKSHMGELYQKIMDEAVHMERFSDALEHIVQSYKKYEDKIAGNIGYEPVSSDLHSVPEEDATGTEKRGWWSRFWDWVWKKEVDPVYTATTEEQEQAADRRFQQEIEVLMESDRFSEERWSEASVEERQQMLEDYMNEVAAILGVDVKSEINFTNKPPEDGKILNGSYTHGRKQVEINSYIIEKYSAANSYSLFTTIVHELRHAYQHAAVDNPAKYQVSAETIAAWKESFRTYSREQKKGYEYYRRIIVEQDARQFAGQE